MPSVAEATDWIVSGLWGGYAAANVLKWHWWRFNGWGYFWGMITGISGALSLIAFPEIKPLEAFPALLLLSTIGSIVGSLVTRPQDMTTLVNFYVRTAPWGWWGPVQQAAAQLNPGITPNRDFPRDAFNVVVGIIWQTAFVAFPIYVVIKDWPSTTVCVAIIAVTTTILNFSWYRRLEA